jgi:ribosomal protein S1/(E)-4-hydroxy-3-methyl-but-2-enyl pyrophosphate reductase
LPVFLAEHAGYCNGVRDALSMTLTQVGMGKKVSTLGPLVHNEDVQRYLESQSVSVVEVPQALSSGTVIIRTHGVTPDVLAYLHGREDLEVIDATCPYVHRVQKIVHNTSQKGHDIIIYGDRQHPEVQALLGWAKGGAQVFEPGKNYREEVIHLSPKTVLLSQTTQREKDFLSLAEMLKERCPDLKICRTICRATVLRQEAAAALAALVDLMIVVGDKKSSNTRKLTQVCQEITTTYQIAAAAEIKREWLAGVRNVGITAGASTPYWTIKEVNEKMEEMEKMEQEQTEEKPEEETSPQDEVISSEDEEISPQGVVITSENGETSPQDEGLTLQAEEMSSQEEIKEYRAGDIVTGTVVMVDDEQVLIDIGYKSEATLPRGEVFLEGDKSLKEQFATGDAVDVLVLKIVEQDDKIIVSSKRLQRERRWKELEEAMEAGANMQGLVKNVVPRGIIIDLGSGVEGFMPGSLVDVRFVPDFEQFRGETFTFKVLELNRERDKVILSRKQYLEAELEVKKQETIEKIKEGDVINGVIKRLTDFGAFVDVGNIDGLVHISEVSWQRVGHPRDVLKVGEEVPVKVLEVIPERERISLSIRQAQPDPWTVAEQEFQADDIVKGRVTRVVNFGAFVELLPGVEGLVHISQMADFHVKHPSEIVQEGEEIEVKIIEANVEAKRISLSIKDARPAPRDFSVQSTQKEENQGVTLAMFSAICLIIKKQKRNNLLR